ncbi:substrate-binding periplasmic protein [Chitinimonas sp. PSY-7]|uniref:substrate-binding periplasmic protein n=1 Tax=Chitinimonas sp. PSY-7 TaxID=3459088 RepID=UPI00403FDE3B
MIELVSEESGLKFEVKPYPWRRAQMLAQRGHGLLWVAIKNKESRKYFEFSHPITHLYHWLVVPKGEEFSYRDIASLHGKRAVIAVGNIYGDEFDANRGKLFSVEEEALSREARLTMLLRDRADVALVSCFQSKAKRLEAKLNQVHGDIGRWSVLPTPLSSSAMHVAAPLGHPLAEHLPAINRAIAKLNKRGAIQALIRAPDPKPDNMQLFPQSF